MAFKPVKGTRDFYPDLMRVRRYIVDTWRRISLRNGFEEYDAPIFEHLDLFTVKSGEEITSQLFSFTDRGGRELAIRPEITPSLARMVGAKLNSMSRPVKWFSVPRLCRAEKPQRGRLREFFQWNVDIIDESSVEADAECIYVLVDFLREAGLTKSEVKVHVGSRPVVTAMLKDCGLKPDGIEKAMPVLDKRKKVPDETFAEMMQKVGIKDDELARICNFMDSSGDEALTGLQKIPVDRSHLEDLLALHGILDSMGVSEYCTFDWNVVRGLDYYTGIVYEAIAEGERAVAGGGRYDELLKITGGPGVGATGFGMGDVVLGLLLKEKSLLPEESKQQKLDVFVVDAGDSGSRVHHVAGRLRSMGLSADFSFNRTRIGKQFKEAGRRNASWAVIIKPNQIGTITETILAIITAREQNLNTIISHRSGETNDNLIVDLAIGTQSGLIKAGGLTGGERLSKYNRILRIEDKLTMQAMNS